MDSEPDYKRLFLEERSRRIEEQRLREEEQRRRIEEQRRTQPTTLPEYLDAWHGVFRSLQVQDPLLGTKGAPFNAKGKPFPNKLCEWLDAPDLLEDIWQRLLTPDLTGSELDLRLFQSMTVETPMVSILQRLFSISAFRERFRLKGTVQYETHANTLTLESSTRGRSSSKRRRESPDPFDVLSDLDTKRREKSFARGWGGADMFCVYNIDGSSSRLPILVAEYKAPHKIGIDNIQLGLREMDLAQIAVAGIDEDLPDSEKIIRICCQCVGALITQAFAYMISRGLRYGYVSTGEAFIFLRISKEDPSVCYYFLSAPLSDIEDGTGWNSQDYAQENRLHLTALSQVLAFTLLAMQSDPEDLDWRESALRGLPTWDLPTDKLTEQLAELRKRCPDVKLTPHTKHRVANGLYSNKSPIRLIRTRSMMRESPPSPTPHRHRHFDDSDDDGSGEGDWPGPPGSNVAVVIRQQPRRSSDPSQSRPASDDRGGTSNRYCTHQCLLGLVRQQPLDPQCPNVLKHGPSHQIDATTLIHRLKEQYDKSLVAGLEELDIHGAVGALYKVTLLSHGYTMVAKATTMSRVGYLEHEASIYKRLEPVQGICVPVYVGAFNLKKRFWYLGCWRISYMMLMSYGGVTILRLPREVEPPGSSHYWEIRKKLEALGVQHNDFEARNQLYDVDSKQPMLIDFERSELKDQRTEPVQPSSPSKRKRDNDEGRVVLKKICRNPKIGRNNDDKNILPEDGNE
ncbi:hypothetical protein FQN55_006649 [Onygenales sp. PD_40]|nr:hypothetical protein FQN55_006649 [Onygenales sp. PD_40]KAK2774289.1 hypothetical protein FQN53_003687 [Emmonsiellopsis sp. PD_33]KAK2782602.1 hypothetical protein FQN52_000812 [Onygenales sp. PD_12]KAK2792499.1 hypothetical protein FQN51_001672 [Onygenales sp. PD_10]